MASPQTFAIGLRTFRVPLPKLEIGLGSFREALPKLEMAL
jgi:hypothetical protein